MAHAHDVVTPDELASRLDTQCPETGHLIGYILLHAGVINKAQLEKALELQEQKETHKRLGQILVEAGMATSSQVLGALSEQLNIPIVNAATFKVQEEARKRIPEDVARAYNVMPLMIHRDKLIVAMSDPTAGDQVNALRFVSDQMVEPVLSQAADIRLAISRYYGGIDAIAQSQEDPLYSEHERARRMQQLAQDRPTIRFVDNLIQDAINRRASDIHLRPRKDNVAVLFRIDGSLVEIRTIDTRALPAITSRLKILGGMNIAEHRLPQDGRHKMKVDNRMIDMRLSVIPTTLGESMVIRILDTRESMKTLSQIGFSEQDEARFRHLISHNQGVLLVTGPTGSGKSTTLYAVLNEVRERNLNIITVEDPVEYQIDNTLQIQVKPKIGYTFARALRHILRHDPDVIMVGEIRDRETGTMAMESALTGHLVLTTLHTNSAATTITRLLDLDIPAYLLNSTLLGILAQRLVQKNCPHCLAPEEIPEGVRDVLGVGRDEVFWKGQGCDKCEDLGFHGRMAAYELLEVTPAIRHMITSGVQSQDIEAQALKDGMVPLTSNALAMAREKLIPLSEVYRVRLE
ncbi:ATPase, T2SS/T4P/T4SS family [Marinobacteraceae bacterium S3BR75-40.1]